MVTNLLSELVKNEREHKPLPSRVDYRFFNYCSTCAMKLPKEALRCPDCNQKVRTKPWHRSKIINWKRI